jgi:eomesodermin protein
MRTEKISFSKIKLTNNKQPSADHSQNQVRRLYSNFIKIVLYFFF